MDVKQEFHSTADFECKLCDAQCGHSAVFIGGRGRKECGTPPGFGRRAAWHQAVAGTAQTLSTSSLSRSAIEYLVQDWPPVTPCGVMVRTFFWITSGASQLVNEFLLTPK